LASGTSTDVTIESDDTDVGRMVGFGLRWSLVNLAGVRVLTFLSGIVMARLLVPHDFGVYAVSLVVAQALLEIDNVGVTQALVRWQGPIARLLPTAMSLSLIASIALYALVFVSAPWLADMLRAPQAEWPIRVLALIAIVDGFAAVPAAALTRSFRQDHRAVADVGGLVVNVALGIVLAISGAGVWSFVIARVAGNAVACIVVIAFAKVPIRPGFDRTIARELLSFGIPLASSGLVSYALLNIDYMLIGRLLGSVALGYYVLAFNLASTPVNIITAAVRRVSVAGFARFVSDPDRLRQAFLSSLRLMLVAALLLGVALSVLCGPLIRVVYGSQWEQSAKVLGCLALMGSARVVINLVEDLMIALGRAPWVLGLQSIWLVLLAPAVYVAASHGGIREVAVTEAVVAGTVMVLALALAWGAMNIGAARLFHTFWRPVVGALASGAAVELLLRTGPSDVVAVISGTLVASAVYAAVVVRQGEVRAVRSIRSTRG
jgi:O-antigen/teichoic acid export membrane protein